MAQFTRKTAAMVLENVVISHTPPELRAAAVNLLFNLCCLQGQVLDLISNLISICFRYFILLLIVLGRFSLIIVNLDSFWYFWQLTAL